jgi:hypothetical protein
MAELNALIPRWGGLPIWAMRCQPGYEPGVISPMRSQATKSITRLMDHS